MSSSAVISGEMVALKVYCDCIMTCSDTLLKE